MYTDSPARNEYTTYIDQVEPGVTATSRYADDRLGNTIRVVQKLQFLNAIADCKLPYKNSSFAGRRLKNCKTCSTTNRVVEQVYCLMLFS